MLRAAIYVWQATYPYAYMYGWALIYTYAYGEMHEAAHTRTGTDTHMGEPSVSRDTCMGSPYAYGQNTCMGQNSDIPRSYPGLGFLDLHTNNESFFITLLD